LVDPHAVTLLSLSLSLAGIQLGLVGYASVCVQIFFSCSFTGGGGGGDGGGLRAAGGGRRAAAELA